MKKILRNTFLAGCMLWLSPAVIAVPVTIGASTMAANGFSLWTTDSTGAPGGSASATFVSGPAAPPLGTGSLNFQTSPGNGNQSAQLRFSGFDGTSLSALTTLQYSTYAASIGAFQLPYLTLYVSKTGLGGLGGPDRIFFEPIYTPAQGAIALGTWQTWNVLTGNVWADSFPIPARELWTSYLAANPFAVIANDPNPLFAGTGGIRFASGFVSIPSSHFDTNIDNFTINGFTYDFELTPEIDPGSCAGPVALALGVLLLLCDRRRAKVYSTMSPLA